VAHDGWCCSVRAITGRGGEGEPWKGTEVPLLDCFEETRFSSPTHRSMVILKEGSDTREIVGSALVAHGTSGCRIGRTIIDYWWSDYWRNMRRRQ
jgi:hypothetical protein